MVIKLMIFMVISLIVRISPFVILEEVLEMDFVVKVITTNRIVLQLDLLGLYGLELLLR